MIVPRKEREPRWRLMERSRRASAPCSTNFRSASRPTWMPPASGKQRMLLRMVGSGASGSSGTGSKTRSRLAAASRELLVPKSIA
jgi:hypothetical protein